MYILLHEMGFMAFFIKMFTGENAEFGFQMKAGMAYASSRYLFGKAAYIIIALGPSHCLGDCVGTAFKRCARVLLVVSVCGADFEYQRVCGRFICNIPAFESTERNAGAGQWCVYEILCENQL